MSNSVSFFVPGPGVVVDPTLKPVPFRQQFVKQGSTALPDPSSWPGAIELVAAALDSGHGANVAPMPVLPFFERLRLQYHGLVQRQMVQNLLRSHPVVGWQQASFANHLEKSLKTSNAYLLGMLYARIATAKWGDANGWGVVQRFWHYSVLSSTAMNFAAASTSQDGNPDFLVQFSNGDWACVEAKGTLGPESDTVLRDGLQQAMKLQSITWQTPGLAPTIATPTNQACSLTYFDAANSHSLEVTLLDPPTKADKKKSKPLVQPVWCPEAGDLVQWSRSLDQFQSLRQSGEPGVPGNLPSKRMRWARWLTSEPIWVGAPDVLVEQQRAIEWTIELLSWLMPELGRWRKVALLSPEASQLPRVRLRKLANQAGNRVSSSGQHGPADESWKLVKSTMEGLAELGPLVAWSDVLKAVWNAELLGPVNDADLPGMLPPKTLSALHESIRAQATPIRTEWGIRARVPPRKSRRRKGLHTQLTANGLLVVALD